jgi:ubiquitin-conjugating enzyme E2 Q
VIAHEYRPGLIRMGEDRFLISVSLPIVQLARRIPLRVLSAWDKRLLVRTQHLTLLVSGLGREYPILESDGDYRREAKNAGVDLSFNVGLCQRYKPSKDQASELVRKHGLRAPEEPIQQPPELLDAEDEDIYDVQQERIPTPEPPEEADLGRLERFGLSTSLESVLQNLFLPVLRLRLKYHLGWAGAETLHAAVETLQQDPDVLFAYLEEECRRADAAELEMSRSYALPTDPLFSGNKHSSVLNLPWLAFTYLLRRFMVIPPACLDTAVVDILRPALYEILSCLPQDNRYKFLRHQALRVQQPPVCISILSHGSRPFSRGRQHLGKDRLSSRVNFHSQYEICHNLPTVDLLVSLAYSAAVGGVLDDPLPVNLGLRVKPPSTGFAISGLGADGLCNFDALDTNGVRQTKLLLGTHTYLCAVFGQKRAAIAELIDSLPAVSCIAIRVDSRCSCGHRSRR